MYDRDLKDAEIVGGYDTDFVPPHIKESGITIPVHITQWSDGFVTAFADGYYSDVHKDAETAIEDIIDQMTVAPACRF